MSEPPAHRFYLDEDVPPSAARIGRALGIDVVAALEQGPMGRKDPEHLAAAAVEGRAVVTYNGRDFRALTNDFFATGKPHAGVLIVVRTVPRVGHVIAHALERWSAARAPLQAYEIQFLSSWSADD